MGKKSRFQQEEVDFSRKKWEEKWDKHFEAAYGWSTSHQDSGGCHFNCTALSFYSCPNRTQRCHWKLPLELQLDGVITLE